MYQANVVLLALIGLAFSYELGTVKKYTYDTLVFIDEHCSELYSVGHRVTGHFHLAALWRNKRNQSLLKIEMIRPQLFVPKDGPLQEHTSELDAIQTTSSYALLQDDTVLRYWDDPAEAQAIRNMKKAVGSLLQFQTQNKQTKEDDVSGSCDVIYTAKGKAVKKRKANCVHPGFDRTLSQAHGVRSAVVHHHAEIDYTLDDDASRTFSRCSVYETIKMFTNTWSRPSLCLDVKLELIPEGTAKNSEIYDDEQVEDVIDRLKEKHPGGLQESQLQASLPEVELPTKKLKPMIEKFRDRLHIDDIANLQSAVAFYKLLPIFRAASKKDILNVLKDKSLEDIKPAILDLVCACSLESCLTAALEHFGKTHKYDELLERFLISLSVLPRPQSYHLERLKEFNEKNNLEEKIRATLLASLGTVLKIYSQNYHIASQELVEEIRTYLESKLEECGAEDPCSAVYLRGLRNAAQPRSVPVFLKIARKGGKSALEALTAIKSIPTRLMPPESQKSLLAIFNRVGARQDRSNRVAAADLLLRMQPGESVLRVLLGSLADQTEPEFATHLTNKILHRMGADPELRLKVLKLLPERHISYYHSLAQSGKTFLFTRPMMSISGLNVTFGLENEHLEGGLVKRSIFYVNLKSQAGTDNLLSVVLFGEGLGALAGGGDADEDEDVSPTGGLDLVFLGSSLRPFIFFSSTSELMGHVWSGTGSELTPLLQCLSAFSDDERLIVLTNGMVAKGHMRGALATDSSAYVKISIWNRNSKSLVKTSGALLLRGSVSVDCGFVSTQAAIQFSGQSKIDFKIDSEFAEMPFQICLQMEHPDIPVKFDMHRSTEIRGSKYHLRKSKKRKIHIPGRSFALHENNNAMCKELLEDE